MTQAKKRQKNKEGSTRVAYYYELIEKVKCVVSIQIRQFANCGTIVFFSLACRGNKLMAKGPTFLSKVCISLQYFLFTWSEMVVLQLLDIEYYIT